MKGRLLFRIEDVRQLLEQTATGPKDHLPYPGRRHELPRTYDGRHLRVDLAGGVRLWASNHDEASAPAVYADGLDPRDNPKWLNDTLERHGLSRLNAAIDCLTVEAGLRDAEGEGSEVTHLGLNLAQDMTWELLNLPATAAKPARRRKARQAGR